MHDIKACRVKRSIHLRGRGGVGVSGGPGLEVGVQAMPQGDRAEGAARGGSGARRTRPPGGWGGPAQTHLPSDWREGPLLLLWPPGPLRPPSHRLLAQLMDRGEQRG